MAMDFSEDEKSKIIQIVEELGFVYEKVGLETTLRKYMEKYYFNIGIYFDLDKKDMVRVNLTLESKRHINYTLSFILLFKKDEFLQLILPNLHLFHDFAKELYSREEKLKGATNKTLSLNSLNGLGLHDCLNLQDCYLAEIEDHLKAKVYFSKSGELCYEFLYPLDDLS